jgi:hypothetical protein
MTQFIGDRDPALLFVSLLVLLSVVTGLGALVLHRIYPLSDDARDNYNVVQGATLTLLALLIGFTLSMAVSRFDQRKNYEEEEANAIGTEYLRADLIGDAEAPKVRALLMQYLDQRIAFYTTHDAHELDIINRKTADLEKQLWASVRSAAVAHPTPIMAEVVAGI